MMTVPEGLDAANRAFGARYAERLDREVRRMAEEGLPVLIRMDDDLVLRSGSRRVCLTIADARYTGLKSVCHLPLGLYLEAGAAGRSAAALESLTGWVPMLESLADPSVHRAGTWADPVDRGLAAAIAAHCLDFVHGCRDDGCIALDRLQRFTAGVRPLTARATERAAARALERLADAVTHLERTFDDEDAWRELFCVVCSGHQPRAGELNMQFFRRYLHDRRIGGSQAEHRLLYGEGLGEEDDALRLVAQRRVDAELGVHFTGSATRLNQDVLAHAARWLLDRGTGVCPPL